MSYIRAKKGQVSSWFHLYIREIQSRSRLTANEEQELAVAIAFGDKDALARMIQPNLLLVLRIAEGFVGRGLAFEDLVGEGNLGLIQAAKAFQPGFGARFSAYAAYGIRQSIRHALINTTSIIRLPAYMITQLTKLRRAERALSLERGNAPSFDEVAAFLGLSESKKKLIARAFQAIRVKLEDNFTLEQVRQSADDMWNSEAERATSIEVDDDQQFLMQHMQRLDERECTILELRYGLAGGVPMSLNEIGRRLGITGEWVRKIQSGALRKLSYDAIESGQSLWDIVSDEGHHRGCLEFFAEPTERRVSRFSEAGGKPYRQAPSSP
jgi:RNA polymerase primary sigma factor